MRYKAYEIPASTPDMTFESLEAYIRRGRHGWHRRIGSVVSIERTARAVEVRLYATLIAILYDDGQVYFPGYVDDWWDTETTKVWLTRIMRDNGLGRGHAVVGSSDKTLYMAGLRVAGMHQRKVAAS